MPTTLVIASGNPHKVEEFRAILAPLSGTLTVVGLGDVAGGGAASEPEETGSTFVENAAIKAISYCRQVGLPCLADDSGLEVDALNGRPGVISSHYFNDGRTDGVARGMARGERDRRNNERLLGELGRTGFEGRSARFVCVLALAVPTRQNQGSRASPPADPPPSQFHSFDGAFRRYDGKLPHMEVAGATYAVTFNSTIGDLDPAERRMVLDACLHWHGSRMHVHVVTVMPDHVHLLIRPLQRADGRWPTLRSVLHSIKTFTSHRINERRHRVGQVWQTEYHDRIERSYDEIIKTREYIELNPVRAGLCAFPGEYPFTALEGRVRSAPEDVGPGCGRNARNPLVDSNGPCLLATFRGTFEGRIGFAADLSPQPDLVVPRGEHGFGYDPLFLVAPEFERTGAELRPQEKNATSHRARAGAELLEWLARPANLARLTPGA